MSNRRRFIKQVAIGGSAAFLAKPLLAAPVSAGGSDKLGSIMPTRPFGKTGEQVTIYCLGGSHVAGTRKTGEDPQAIIERAIEEGVRFFDNAYNYAGGYAEELYGQHLTPKYREQIFLMTKSQASTKEGALRELDTSLTRMKTDYLDLWLMHAVSSAEDVDKRLAGGVLEAFLEARQAGKARYLGFSGHTHSAAHRRLIERVAGDDPFSYVQLPVNAVDASKPDSFTTLLVPDLAARGYAIGAMKTLAFGSFFGGSRSGRFQSDDPIIPNHISLEDALWYALAQPVTCIVSGNDRLAYLKENVAIAKRFATLSPDDQQQIVAKVAKFRMTPHLEFYRPDPRSMA